MRSAITQIVQVLVQNQFGHIQTAKKIIVLLIGVAIQSNQISQNPWRQDRISPVHRQCVGELRKKK